MSSVGHFPWQLVAALHLGDKREIAAELAASGVGQGVAPFHGLRADGSCTCCGPSCADPGKHPDVQLVRNGVSDATTNPREAWSWVNAHPDHNLALRLGPHYVALDYDPRKGANLADDCGLPQRTMAATSGGGGLHRLYRHDDPVPLKSGVIAPGVEFRTGNQAIIVERSRHISGTCYSWHDLQAPIATVPEPIAARLRKHRGPEVDLRLPASGVTLDRATLRRLLPSVQRLRLELLRGKHRAKARLLLEGRWEVAGYESQSAAEYNLLLLVSGMTEDHMLQLAVLLTSGLAKRDRECTRRDDHHGRKLARADYLESLLREANGRRAELRQIGDPNLALAQRVFGSVDDSSDGKPSGSPPTPHQGGSVVDAKKKHRGRPKGAPKRRRARLALVTFLASDDVVVDHNGYVRVPIAASADAAGISREVLRQAIHDLLGYALVEGPDPKAYKKRGEFANDRYLRLAMPADQAIARARATR